MYICDYLWFIPASILFLHFVSGHSSIETPSAALSGFVFVGAGRTSQRWDCGMSGMLSRQSFLLHSSLLPWKLCERRPQMMLPRVRFAGL